ncbi:MAG: hypothetical protein QF521_03780 [Alphaproteobacteria bacterium]|jgi:hypothetical protein|nr:hypothetical protein [Alphaproteobacteria bacterium]
MTPAKTAILACSLSVALVAPAMAKTEVVKAISCWTGTLDMMVNTKKDMGWTYSLKYTWLAEDEDPKKNMSGRCVGSGGLVAGKYESAPYYCTVLAADGSTYMVKGMGSPKGSKGTIYGGTGAFKGVSGTVTGGPRIKLPSAKGQFAYCAHDVMERTMPD